MATGTTQAALRAAVLATCRAAYPAAERVLGSVAVHAASVTQNADYQVVMELACAVRTAGARVVTSRTRLTRFTVLVDECRVPHRHCAVTEARGGCQHAGASLGG